MNPPPVLVIDKGFTRYMELVQRTVTGKLQVLLSPQLSVAVTSTVVVVPVTNTLPLVGLHITLQLLQQASVTVG